MLQGGQSHPRNVYLYTYNFKWVHPLVKILCQSTISEENAGPAAAIHHLVGLSELAMVASGGSQFG